MRRYLFIIFLLPLFLFPDCIHAQGGEPELAEQYFQDGEYESALNLFVKLQRKDQENKAYNFRIPDCHQKLSQFKAAVSFLEKVSKRQPEDFYYPFLLADAYRLTGDFKKADKAEDDVIRKNLKVERDFIEIGAWLQASEKNELALASYLQGRKTLKSKYVFAEEIAGLYKKAGKYTESAEEYLSQYLINPHTLSATKANILGLVGPESTELVEKVLLQEVNKNGKDLGLREIIFEFYVLSKNFYEALVQCKSLDKVNHESGGRVFQYAITLRNNKEYRLSGKALDYIIEEHENSAYFLKALQEKAVNGELQAFETLPADTNAVREAVDAYDQLLNKFGRKAIFFNAMYRKANLLAFYLFDLDAAMSELDLATKQALKPKELAEVNLLIGDILLMQKKYNLAKLKYTEVVGSWKEGQIGALGKYKQGRLSYFKGDFEYSRARLQTIKDNTSNDISNDAIRLFLLIQDNIGLDTTTFPLQRFAQAQLLVFQRDFEPALELLDSVQFAFPNNTLADEIIWEKANIFLQQSKIEKSLAMLDKLITEYGTDIYGDDALFTKAKLYDYNLQDKDKAMRLYIDFLKSYSGSLYVVEVRKRIRELRASKRI